MRNIAIVSTFLLLAPLAATAQSQAVPPNIAALRAQIVTDAANLRSIARQITDTQNGSSEKVYVDARLKYDADMKRLQDAAQPLLVGREANLRLLLAQAEAATIAGDTAQATSLKTQYRQQKLNYSSYRQSLIGNF
jgi:hypothetical protein